MRYALFAASASGAGVDGLGPAVTVLVPLTGSTSLAPPAVVELDDVAAKGWYYIDLAPNTEIVIEVDLDPGNANGVVGVQGPDGYALGKMVRFIARPEHGKYTSERAAALDRVTAARMEKLDTLSADVPAAVWSKAIGWDVVGGEGGPQPASHFLSLITLARTAIWDSLPDAIEALPALVWDVELGGGPAGEHIVEGPMRVWSLELNEAVPGSALELIAGICACVWNRPANVEAYPVGSMGWIMQVLAAVAAKANVRIDPLTYDGDKLTQARIRVYLTAADAATDQNHIAQFLVDAEWIGDNLDLLTSVLVNP